MTSRAPRMLAALLVAALACVAAPRAEARTSSRQFLETQLRTSSDFRNRVQAALALGRLGQSESRSVLERALGSDSNEAVRAAAAAALGQLGDRRSIPALTRASRDRSDAVRRQASSSLASIRGESPAGGGGGGGAADWRRARYVVVVGSVRNNADFGGASLAGRLREALMEHLGTISGVVPFPAAAQIDADAQRQIARRRLPVFQVDATLNEVQRGRQGTDTRVRGSVNLVLMDQRTSNVRGVLTGSASATERTNSDRRQTLRMAGASMDAAVRGALASANSAFSQAVRASR